ncbi:MAG: hypothetical protein PHG94_00885 [Syntrophomonas sp.]|nr:hypothetical protein [Syntrophomonas sp.]
MTGILKKIKFLIVFLSLLLLLVGGYYLLLYLNLLSAPAFLKNTPLLGNYVSQSMEKVSKLQYEQALKQKEMAMAENRKLLQTLQDKAEEMEKTRASLADLKKRLKRSEQEDDNLKEEIAQLNSEILDLKSRQEGRSAAYKDMATYFGEMKAKTAADILSRLEDEDIIGIFSQMESDTVAELMENMDADRAARISKKMLVAAP